MQEDGDGQGESGRFSDAADDGGIGIGCCQVGSFDLEFRFLSRETGDQRYAAAADAIARQLVFCTALDRLVGWLQGFLACLND